MNAIAIILAAGSGSRLGTSKAFIRFGKTTLLKHTIQIFERHPNIERVIVVCREQDCKKVIPILQKLRTKKAPVIVSGGKTRQASCFNALKVLETLRTPVNTPLLIHNVANPFVTRNEVTSLLRAIKSVSAAALAQSITDTVKEVRGAKIRTLERCILWKTQTPQAMTLKIALAAHEKARKQKYIGTDDIELVERLGKKVKLIPCSEENIKITTPLSLKLAQMLLHS